MKKLEQDTFTRRWQGARIPKAAHFILFISFWLLFFSFHTNHYNSHTDAIKKTEKRMKWKRGGGGGWGANKRTDEKYEKFQERMYCNWMMSFELLSLAKNMQQHALFDEPFICTTFPCEALQPSPFIEPFEPLNPNFCHTPTIRSHSISSSCVCQTGYWIHSQ